MLATRNSRLSRHGVLETLSRSSLARPLPVLTRELRVSSSTRQHKGRPDIVEHRPSIYRQVRYYTSPASQAPLPQRPESFGQVMRRAIRFSNIFKGQTLRQMFRDSPEETSLALFLLLGTAGIIGYVVYLYFSYFYSRFFTRYPPEIAKSLRRALYYSNESRDDKLALKYYKLALEQCPKHGLDPFSDEVMGIKIQMAAWLEKIGHIKAAADILSTVLSENKKWLSVFETAPQTLPSAPVPGTVVGEGESQRTITKEEFESWLWSSRNRILAKSCAISVKVGELYADDHVMQNDKSHEALTWAVETSLEEFRRRAKEGVKEGEGDWLTPEEIGGSFESLAHSYERKEQFDLALPLFFQALRLCKDQCHLAVIMNNLAVAFAQHPPHAPYETFPSNVSGENRDLATPSSDQPWTRKELLESAQRWAKNALSHAKEPQGEQRTSECDQACAVALINLGDIAAIAGDRTQAIQSYKQSIKVSEKTGYADGVSQASSRLEQISN